MRRVVRFLLLLVAGLLIGSLLLGMLSRANAQSAPSNGPAPIERVSLVTDKGTFHFKTELAITDSQRQRGLMFRHRLPNDRAMLFDWGRDLQVNMWMKNTYISLDMIFINREGKIINIARATKPKSLDVVASKGKVAAVLEVVAGTADRIGAKPGDKVIHSLFGER